MANKKSIARAAHSNSYEALKSISEDALSSVTDGLHEDLFGQLFGWSFNKKNSENPQDVLAEIEAYDPTQGIEIFNRHKAKLELLETKAKNAKASEQSNEKKHHKAGYDYVGEILHGRKVAKQELREVHTRVDDIMVELRKLISSSKILQVQFAEVTIDQPPAEIGTYHVNFYEWLLSVIKIAREKVEDSSVWLQAINTKKSKKMGYWGMFKKHGTTFGLSHERNVATQTG